MLESNAILKNSIYMCHMNSHIYRKSIIEIMPICLCIKPFSSWKNTKWEVDIKFPEKGGEKYFLKFQAMTKFVQEPTKKNWIATLIESFNLFGPNSLRYVYGKYTCLNNYPDTKIKTRKFSIQLTNKK